MTKTPLISAEDLLANADAAVAIDASWHMPSTGRDARAEFEAGHVPGAAFFDIDAVADRTSDLPHMLPSPEVFAEAVGAMGIGPDDHVVVYDTLGLFSAARGWWTFRAMGHARVSVLDGGLPAWRAAGGALETGPARRAATVYRATPDPALVRDAASVRAALSSGAADVLDARPAARFNGHAPEPRAGLRSGAMPGAKSLPYSELLTPDGRMKPPEELKRIFTARAAGERPLIATCGSGVTASVIALAAEVAGVAGYSVYDGSWAEWGRESNDSALFPVVTGTLAS